MIGVALLSCLMHVPAIYLRSADWNGKVDSDHNPNMLWSWSDPPFLFPLGPVRSSLSLPESESQGMAEGGIHYNHVRPNSNSSNDFRIKHRRQIISHDD